MNCLDLGLTVGWLLGSSQKCQWRLASVKQVQFTTSVARCHGWMAASYRWMKSHWQRRTVIDSYCTQTRVRTHARSHTHTHSRTHAHARTHAHTHTTTTTTTTTTTAVKQNKNKTCNNNNKTCQWRHVWSQCILPRTLDCRGPGHLVQLGHLWL